MFKEKFKYYKRKSPLPDLSSVLEMNPPFDPKQVRRISPKMPGPLNLDSYGINSLDTWVLLELIQHPGLIILRNPFTPKGQRYWIRKCLEEYTRPPNKNNLLTHGLLSENDDWWHMCNDNEAKSKIYKQLRWVTLGYHHNWDTKVYSENLKNDFPPELNELCKIIGKCIGNWDVDAQAAIINFYHMDSTLSGHTDHSEPNNTAPLFSFSFGQNAVFLIGGQDINDDATAILVESGDCIVMSSQSRLSYHGVPKIVATKLRPWSNEGMLSEDWKDFENYVTESRINMNVRQVLNPGQKHL
ncbi:nucleic acid dioxygenase ALKBH1 [Cimex lectularius]|uniref:Fe2OG dioxygenase domain-containing protein n=1 Tax=Cimex lectularius TaxID=79782 RepID=A0A8I6RK90_CIMLE|nr:nucleic acid dioxygenase ALKBH1 [Cimex lectularius]